MFILLKLVGIYSCNSIFLFIFKNYRYYKSIPKYYIKETSFVMVCFDFSNPKTFLEVESVIKELKNQEYSHQILLIGCKSDLDRFVEKEKIERLCQIHNLKYFETSSKTRNGIEELKCYLKDRVKMRLKIMNDKHETHNSRENWSICVIQ